MPPSTRKSEILTQAAHLFRRQGYQGTSLKNIANAVGMDAAPSLYNHISSKQAILEELILKVARSFHQGMSTIYGEDQTPSQQLKDIISLHVRLTIAEPNAIALVWQEWVHLDEDSKAEFLQLRARYEENFKSILVKGMQTGEFRKLDLEITLFTLLSTLRSLYAWYSRNRDYTEKTLTQQLSQALLHGLVKGD